MRVAHVITSLDSHGAQMMLYKVLSSMDHNSFDPVVVSLADGGALREKFEALGLPIYSLGMGRGVPSPASVYRFARLMKQLNPDLIQGWMYHGNLAAQLIAAFSLKRVPVLW